MTNERLYLTEPWFRPRYPLYNCLIMLVILVGMAAATFVPSIHQRLCKVHPENPDWCVRVAAQTIAQLTKTTIVLTAIDSELSADPSQWKIRWTERFEQPSTGKFSSVELVWATRGELIQLELSTHYQPTGRIVPVNEDYERHQYSHDVGTVSLPAHFGTTREINYAALQPLYFSLTGVNEFPTLTETSLATACQTAIEAHERKFEDPVIKFLIVPAFISLVSILFLAFRPIKESATTLRQLAASVDEGGLSCAPPPSFWQLIRCRNPFETAANYAEMVAGICSRQICEVQRSQKSLVRRARQEQQLAPLMAEVEKRIASIPALLEEFPDALQGETVQTELKVINDVSRPLDERLSALRRLEFHLRTPAQVSEDVVLEKRVKATDTTSLNAAILERFQDFRDNGLAETRPKKRAYWFRKALEVIEKT